MLFNQCNGRKLLQGSAAAAAAALQLAGMVCNGGQLESSGSW